MELEIKAFVVYFLIHVLAEADGKRNMGLTHLREEISNLTNVSCGQYDSCKEIPNNVKDNIEDRGCECGPQCNYHDTCCLDSPNRVSPRFMAAKGPPLECVSIPQPSAGTSPTSFFMAAKCHPGWRGNRDVISKCQQSTTDPRDPYNMVPAVYKRMKITFKNYFCGLCNGVDPKELELWNVELIVILKDYNEKIEEEMLMEQISFDEDMKKWGYWESEQGEREFRTVTIKPKIPETGISKFCIRDLISKCHPSWTERVLRDKCQAYTSIIYHTAKLEGKYLPTKTYRNVHCAICNFASLKNGFFECPRGVVTALGAPLTFTLLLDVNSRDGPKVGRVSKCKQGESYDPFAKKCRTLECGIPGYAVVGNRCAKV